MKNFISYLILVTLFVCTEDSIAKERRDQPLFFDFGNGIIEEFQGTYEFIYEKIVFNKLDASSYSIQTTHDRSQPPTQDRLQINNGYSYWVLGWSHENWFMIKNVLKKNDQWKNHIRGWEQNYRVEDTGFVLETPAGTLKNCVKIRISWIANEHDMKGLQERIIYLAPHLGIVKQEAYSQGAKWHEEVLSHFEILH